MSTPNPPLRPLKERLLWFVVLWICGFGAVTILGYGLKLWIAPK